MASVTSMLGRIKEWWGKLTAPLRWTIIGSAVALLVAVGVGYWLNRPQWVALITNAQPQDAAAIVNQLQSLKVPYQPTGDGYTIMVPKTEEYTAKLALAQAGLPKGGTTGWELFDNPSFGTTDFDRQVNLLRAQQGELARALMRISNVSDASVNLAIPDQSVFTRDQKPVTAAVLVKAKPGSRLTPDQVVGIVNFVSNSVQGLSPDNVKVVDENGKLLSNGVTGNSALAAAGADQNDQQSMQKAMEQRVQSLLEPIFGVGNVVARVNLQLSNDAVKVEDTTVGNSVPKTVDSTHETTTGTTTGTPGAAAGTGGTAPTYPGQGTSGTTDSSTVHTTTTYENSQHHETRVTAPGGVAKVSVGIAVNKPDLTPAQIQQIQQTVAGATGADLASISVAAMAFSRELPAGLSVPAVKPLLQPSTLAVSLVAALVVLLMGYFLINRRRGYGGYEPEPLLAEAPFSSTVGGTLDVALGLEPTFAQMAAADGVPGGDQDAADGLLPTQLKEPQTAAEKLEIIMKSRPKRQLVIDGQPVDETLMHHVDDLIDLSPEAAAETIRQWLKGGF